MSSIIVKLPQKVATTAVASAALLKGRHTPVDATSGLKTMTLPTGAAEGVAIGIEKVDSSSNVVNVTGHMRGLPGQTIALSQQYSSLELVADAAGSWWPNAHHIQIDPADLANIADLAPAETDLPASPSPDPTAGVESTYSRGDHAHPSDGLFMPWGTGYDGDLNFDGTTTVVIPSAIGGTNSFVPSAGVYTINQPIAARVLTLGNGVVLAIAQGCIVSVSELLTCPTGSAIIHADGVAGAANGTAGAARAAAITPATGAGGAGNTGAGSAGSSVTGPTDQWNTNTGGSGGLGPSGAGGGQSGGLLQNKVTAQLMPRTARTLLTGELRGSDYANSWANMVGAGGGGGGGGDGTNKGGGGGSGAGVLIVNARKIIGNIMFRANGGNGGSPTTGNAGGGGGGGGGAVFVNSLDMTGYTGPTTTGSVSSHAKGGTGGTKVGTGVNGVTAGNGYVFVTVWE